MDKLDEQMSRLEAQIVEVEARFLALREENARLRAALAGSRPGELQDGARPESRPVQLAMLEAERREIRSRLQNLIEAL